jgi:hypothetical protein
MLTGAAIKRKMSPVWMVTLPRWKGPPGIWGKVRADLASGYQAQTACCRARERPMAVMSGARRGAVRSGR